MCELKFQSENMDLSATEERWLAAARLRQWTSGHTRRNSEATVESMLRSSSRFTGFVR